MPLELSDHELAWMALQEKRMREINPSARLHWSWASDNSYGYTIFWEDVDHDHMKRHIGFGGAITAVEINIWLNSQKHERGIRG